MSKDKKSERVNREELLAAFAQDPRSVDSQFNEATELHKEQFYKQLYGKFEITGMPDHWDYDWFMDTLFKKGYLCITDTYAGVVPLECGLAGINIWSRPTSAIIANHLLGSFQRTIGKNCVVVRLQYNFGNVTRLANLTSGMLSCADGSIATNLINTRVAFIAEAEDKTDADTWKTIYDDVSSGKPAVVVRKGLLSKGSNYTYLNPKQSFIADQVVDLKKELEADRMRKIGIKNTVDKKQRVQSAEVDSVNDQCDYNIQHWIKTITRGLDEANKMFGLNLKLKVNDFSEEVDDGEGGNPLQPDTVEPSAT